MIEYGSWLSFLYKLGVPGWIPDSLLISFFIMLCLCIAAFCLTRNLRPRNPGKPQIALEYIMKALMGFVDNLCPSEKKILRPVLGTTFLLILFSNYIGIVPGFISPSSKVLFPVTMALMAFVFIQVMGFMRKGFGYLKHFVGEPVWLAPLNIPIHVIGEIARPISLSCRLYGNIYGEEMVICVLMYITLYVMGANIVPLRIIPLQLPMMLFGLFSGFIQAFIFTLLVGQYISMAVSHEEE
ncbi:MAG: F0F1 ATP synthase subunit A [Abditibacteriota bacterium]|nr:F0F1 ATP synthase subunit A [Abditibacteriota bacterium]